MNKQIWLPVVSLILAFGACDECPSDELSDDYIRTFIPDGAGPFPTLIAIPGCSGIAFDSDELERSTPELQEDDRAFRKHYLRMAERFRSAGYAVMLVDVLSAEGRVTACADNVPSQTIADYIDATISRALATSFADRQRIGLVGWSMGGWGTLAWLARQRKTTNAVQSAAVVYPGCRDIEPLSAEIPILMLLGGADDIATPSVCRELVERSDAKDSIRVIEYANGRHGFDVIGLPAVLQLTDGVSVGFQELAASKSWDDLIDFFEESP